MTQHEFMDAVQEQLHLEDSDDAAQRTTVVLATFSEILYRTERESLSDPLPMTLAHILQSTPSEDTGEDMERLNAEAFLERVQARADLSREEARDTVSAVLSVLEETVGSGPLAEIADHLPASYGELFAFVPTSEASDSPS